MNGERIPIPGSERAPLAGARVVGPPDVARMQVTVVLADGAAADAVVRFAADFGLEVAPRETTSFSPKDVAALYGFPTDVNGSGQVVGIFELDRGLNTDDLATDWRQQGVSPTPVVTAIGVDGASSQPDGPDGADGEVMLDVEIVGSRPAPRSTSTSRPTPTPASSTRSSRRPGRARSSRRVPSRSLTSAIGPAHSGATALVPPTTRCWPSTRTSYPAGR